MKKLLAVLAAFVLAFSFGVFADNHEEVEITSVETEETHEEETEVEVEVEVDVEVDVEVTTEEEMEEETTEEDTARAEGGVIALELQTAIDFLYENELTMFGTEETFMGEQSLRRDEAAAFFARFARDVLGMEVDADASCEFSDLAMAHQDLLGEIEAACQLGLMRGHDGNFMPTDTFSNAHAMTVLVRLLMGDQEEVEGNWAANYAAAAQEAGLTASLAADTQANLYAPITRADVAKMIEGATLVEVDKSTPNLYEGPMEVAEEEEGEDTDEETDEEDRDEETEEVEEETTEETTEEETEETEEA